MKLNLELTGYRRYRTYVLGTVRVRGDDFFYADNVNLSTSKGRQQFIATLEERLNGYRPEGLDLDRELLGFLQEAEQHLASDPAPTMPAATDDEERIEDYARRAGRYEYVKVKETPAGPIEVRIPLSNFLVRIAEDIEIDDGAQSRRYLLLEGRLGGRQLPTIRVEAADFAAMAWVIKHWGIEARVLPGLGRKELLRDCIQAFSAEATFRTVYGHLGWRRVGGRFVYLHGGGAIGAEGSVEGIEVELEGKLAGYRLPAPPDGDPLREAVRASWDLWRVAAPEAAAPLQGAAYGAPLAEWLRPDFTLWTRGRTGLLKTTYDALQLSHFGEFDQKNVPVNFESTANALERESFLVKDCIFLVDDFRPPADRYEAGEMRRKAARLLRAAGNRSGRGRMKADTSLRPEYWPRGIVVATAEEQAPGESTAARAWEVEFHDGTVNLTELTAAQGKTELLRLAMAGYLRWLAGRLEADASWLHALHRAALEQARGVGGHLRHPQTLAYLLTSWSVFAEFAQSVGAVTPDEAAARLADVKAALVRVATRQAEVARRVRPDIVFIETLADLLAGGRAHLAATSGDAPADAGAYGWKEPDAMTSDDDEAGPQPRGDRLGWVDDECLYLIPSLVHRLVARIVMDRGDSFIISERALNEALHRGSFLLPGNKGLRHNQWAEGTTRNTIRLSLAAVSAAWGRTE